MNGIKILYLEDSEFDVEIVRYLFEQEKIEFNLKHVSNREDFIRVFEDFRPDIILANISVPSFEGIEALHIVREKDTDVPVIFLSGILGEEHVIEVLKNGATDYVLKHRLSRLIPSVRRALLELQEKTKRIQAEQLKRKYDFIVNTSRSMFTIINRQYIYEAVNDAFCRAHKLVRNEIVGKSLPQLWGKEIFEKHIKKNFDQSFSDNVVRYQAWFDVPKYGLRCFEVTFYPYKEYGQDVTHTVVDTMDITDQQKAEDALHESEARYRMLFDYSIEAIILEKDKKIHTCNSTTLDFFLESRNNIINHSVLDFSPKVQADGIESEKKLANSRKEALDGNLVVFDWLLELHDGSQIDTEIGLSYFSLGSDEFYQYFIHDISEKKKADAMQKMLYTAIEQSAEIVCITDSEGIIEYVNTAYLKVTGYKLKELIGKSFRVMLTKEHPEEFYDQISESIARENNWRGNMKIRRKDGKSIEVNSSISPVRNATGGIIKHVVVQRDITDETRIQNYLERAQRLETIGTLAGGIAHDFNNILATIIGHTEITMEDLPKDHPSFHDLEQILKASNRARDLVNKILSFSRQMEPKIEAVNLGSFIQDAIRMLDVSVPKKIIIKTNLEKKCPPVLVDPSHIHQVILNICTNAFYAMRKKGGTLFISVENQEADDDFVKKYPHIRKGKYVRTDFRDTGIGMKQDNMERIFEPFFTTKPVGEGTGLGLSVVHGLIKNMKGEILVESKPGKGSTFSILLPVNKANAIRTK